MRKIMESFHAGLDSVSDQNILRIEDYSIGLNGLPKSDVLKYFYHDDLVPIRPSDTEPKLKAYISVTAENRAAAEETEKRIAADLEKKLN